MNKDYLAEWTHESQERRRREQHNNDVSFGLGVFVMIIIIGILAILYLPLSFFGL